MGTFNPAQSTFPNNVIQIIKARLDIEWDNVTTVLRPLRPTDPNFAIGMFGSIWTPEQDSVEMRGQLAGLDEPTVERWMVGVQTLVKAGDEQVGLAHSSVLAESVRTMLYRDETLRVGLVALTTSVEGATKRITRFWVAGQRFLSNEVSGQFTYLSTLEFGFETETH